MFELSSGRVPDSLHACVVVAPDFDLAISGSSIADSIRVYRLRLSDPLDPVPGAPQGGDSIVPFLYRLMVSSSSSPLAALGASALCHGGVLDFTGYGLGYSSLHVLPFLVLLLLAPSVTPIPSSLPSVLAPPGFPFSFTFSLAPTFPVASPCVTSVGSSLPLPAPPRFPAAPPFHPLAPPIGVHHPVHSLAPSVAPYSFPVSYLLLSGHAASSTFLPSCAPAPAASFPRTSVASFSFPFGSTSSADTVVSRSLLTIVSCWAASLSSLLVPTPSLVQLVVSLSSAASSLLASAPGYPSAPPARLFFLVSSGALGIPPSASGVSGGF